jgi:hypothetical protein
MGLIRIISVSAAAFVVASSAAPAQQPHTGTVTQINRLNNTIGIRPTQSGTVGANTAGAAEEFKVENGISLETLHAGDRVSYSESGGEGTKTITKIDRQ